MYAVMVCQTAYDGLRRDNCNYPFRFTREIDKTVKYCP